MVAEAPGRQAPTPQVPTTAASVLPGFPFVRLPPFDVHLPTFDGPLELLLGLLREGDLAIMELALVQVTDQYLAHVQALRELDVEAIAGFLAVAAHLLVLKSRAIVPREPPAHTEADEGGIRRTSWSRGCGSMPRPSAPPACWRRDRPAASTPSRAAHHRHYCSRRRLDRRPSRCSWPWPCKAC